MLDVGYWMESRQRRGWMLVLSLTKDWMLVLSLVPSKVEGLSKGMS